MTDTAKHSPLPWRIEQYTNYVGFSISSPSGELRCVAERWYPGSLDESANEEMEANAAFIVRACNSHAALVEVLTELLDDAWIKQDNHSEWFVCPFCGHSLPADEDGQPQPCKEDNCLRAEAKSAIVKAGSEYAREQHALHEALEDKVAALEHEIRCWKIVIDSTRQELEKRVEILSYDKAKGT